MKNIKETLDGFNKENVKDLLKKMQEDFNECFANLINEIKEDKNAENTKASTEPEFPDEEELSNKVLKRIAKKLSNGDIDELKKLNDLLIKYYPSVIFSLYLKEIAIELDKRYEDHISKCETIYVFNYTSGNIIEVNNTGELTNFKNFAAFRNIDDIDYALTILESLYKIMYPEYYNE